MNTPATVEVRRATVNDAEALARLRYEFRSSRAESIESEAEFLPRCAAWMSHRLAAAESWRAWVIELDGMLVGNVWLELIEKLPNPGNEREWHGYITNVYVRAEHRGSGVGSRLLTAALDECSRVGVDSIFLWPSDRSRPLYLRHGFKPADEVFIRTGAVSSNTPP